MKNRVLFDPCFFANLKKKKRTGPVQLHEIRSDRPGRGPTTGPKLIRSNVVNRPAYCAGSRSDRSDRPVRSGFKNIDGKACLITNASLGNSDWDENSCDQEVVTAATGEFIDVFPNLSTDFSKVLEKGFGLRWWQMDACQKCEESGGQCGRLSSTGVICFCSDGTTTRANCKARLKIWHKSGFLVIGLPIITGGFLLGSFIYCYIRKKKAKRNEDGVGFSFTNNLKSLKGSFTEKDIIGKNVDLHVFDLSTIAAATDNFSPSKKLGEGGFGSVYKGKLLNGQEIAVKRLSQSSSQGIQEFKTEVTLIAKLQHKNLVRLLGYCFLKEEKMLVYEYLPNKGLDSFIFDHEKASLLDWKKRFQIIQGIVRGLLYLHHDSRLKIIHRDLKASNVLLDTNLNPKISDFGLAKIFGGDEEEAKTRRVVGTYGYMSPEYAMEGRFSVKSDVFSFGILVLEIISGRKNNSYYQENSLNLIGHVWELWKQDRALATVDSSIGDSFDAGEVLLCIHVGILCVQELVSDRPTMKDVAFMLSNHETRLPSPNQPAFIFRQLDNGMKSTSASAIGGVGSDCKEPITVVYART